MSGYSIQAYRVNIKNLLQQNNNARKPQLLDLGKVGTFPDIPLIDIDRIRPSPFDLPVMAWLPHQLPTAQVHLSL